MVTKLMPTTRRIDRKVSVYAYDLERARIEAKRSLRRLSRIQEHVSRPGSRPAAERGMDSFDLHDDERCVNDICEKASLAQAALRAFLDAKDPPTYGGDR